MGFPAHFIIDQGRGGSLGKRTEWGQWCNIKNAGFGPRPTTATNDPLVDAIVWVKPGMFFFSKISLWVLANCAIIGGESDGTSDPASARFDTMCVSPVSDTPAPEAGSWFEGFTERLIINAQPPIPPLSL